MPTLGGQTAAPHFLRFVCRPAVGGGGGGLSDFPANIAPILLDRFPKINPEQRRVIAHVEGPLLVIAGPGSGKTFSLVLRAINLLLTERAKPSELMLCTFTEKAAYELQDRIGSAARAVNYKGDLSELRVGTIHGICKDR